MYLVAKSSVSLQLISAEKNFFFTSLSVETLNLDFSSDVF